MCPAPKDLQGVYYWPVQKAQMFVGSGLLGLDFVAQAFYHKSWMKRHEYAAVMAERSLEVSLGEILNANNRAKLYNGAKECTSDHISTGIRRCWKIDAPSQFPKYNQTGF